MAKLFRFLLLLLPTLLLTVVSCKKEDGPATPPATTPTTPTAGLTATLDKATVTPGDYVTITTSGDLDATKTAWEITVGGQKVTAGKMEARKAVFLVPALAVGALPLDLMALGVKTAPALTMGAYTPITNPEQVLTAYNTQLSAAIVQLDKLSKDPAQAVPAQDVASMRSLQQTFSGLKANLTPAEMLEVAYVLQKLPMTIINFSALPQMRGVAGPAATAADPGEDFISIGKAFVTSVTITAAGIGVFALAIKTPEAIVSKIIATVALTTAILHLDQSLHLITKLVRRFDIIAELNLLASDGSASALKLVNAKLAACGLTAVARTFTAADGGTSPFVQSIIDASGKLEQFHNTVIGGFNNVKSWFGDAKPLAQYVNPIKQVATRGSKVLAASLVKIRNISNSAISLTASPVNSTVNLTATSSTLKVKTPFTFDVAYENATLGVSVTKTINAEFEPEIDSTAIYTASALGKYSVNNYKGNGPNSKLFCELKSSGQATYTIYDDPSWNNGHSWTISWSIRKSNGRYYYLDGWWNGQYNVSVNNPLKHPVTSFKYHNGTTYSK